VTMWENWEKLLNEVVIIKWGVVCIAVSMWVLSLYFLLKNFLSDMYLSSKKKDEDEDEFGTHKLILLKRRKQDGK